MSFRPTRDTAASGRPHKQPAGLPKCVDDNGHRRGAPFLPRRHFSYQVQRVSAGARPTSHSPFWPESGFSTGVTAADPVRHPSCVGSSTMWRPDHHIFPEGMVVDAVPLPNRSGSQPESSPTCASRSRPRPRSGLRLALTVSEADRAIQCRRARRASGDNSLACASACDNTSPDPALGPGTYHERSKCPARGPCNAAPC
jgi:hypothetical protein